MSEQKSGADKSRTRPAEEPYEPEAFARKYGIPPGEAKTIIKRYGPSRKKLDSYMAAREA
ncbi:DUF3606 domain-containing protein [Aureimonas phyllosphaerae]|uniref:DUF3606 domain-containing protein n=1 Tax=Aureimonas phyllosphaerae TaxID=1166078 RepID=A0A7W6FVH2_9HYPH|nr:DUF3606 domain-containing protein [Aureimonas phyllosphaerae]MBB3937188.1 hypothetical protein [Aureimonas phyllosphaerae]MBB3961175.1 hypothetical protein [Aureimonas phyllosphaerae]SFF48752.1 Protein of unknown function [Aureimonas phyllosphaerae]